MIREKVVPREEELAIQTKLEKAISDWSAVLNIYNGMEASDSPVDQSQPEGFFNYPFQFEQTDEETDLTWKMLFTDVQYNGLDRFHIVLSKVAVTSLKSEERLPLPSAAEKAYISTDSGYDYRRDVRYKFVFTISLSNLQIEGDFRYKEWDDLSVPDELMKELPKYHFRFVLKNFLVFLAVEVTQVDERFVLLDSKQQQPVRFYDLRSHVWYRLSNPEKVENYEYTVTTEKPTDIPQYPDSDSDPLETASTTPLQHFARDINDISEYHQYESREIVNALSSTYLAYITHKSIDFVNAQKKTLETLNDLKDMILRESEIVSVFLSSWMKKSLRPRIASMSSVYELLDVFKSIIMYRCETPNVKDKQQFEKFFFETVNTKSKALNRIKEYFKNRHLSEKDNSRLDALQMEVDEKDDGDIERLELIFIEKSKDIDKEKQDVENLKIESEAMVKKLERSSTLEGGMREPPIKHNPKKTLSQNREVIDQPEPTK